MTESAPEQNEAPVEEVQDRPGSIRFGPLTFSAKFSLILIYVIILGFNILLLLIVVLAALHRSGRI
jgi:hypothetical protein